MEVTIMTAEELWKEFCEQKKIDHNTPYEAWAFCGGGPAADELAELVLERKKFMTYTFAHSAMCRHFMVTQREKRTDPI